MLWVKDFKTARNQIKEFIKTWKATLEKCNKFRFSLHQHLFLGLIFFCLWTLSILFTLLALFTHISSLNSGFYFYLNLVTVNISILMALQETVQTVADDLIVRGGDDETQQLHQSRLAKLSCSNWELYNP